MATSRIVVLASSIESNTKLIDEYYRSNGLPSPSFEQSTPPVIPLPPEIAQVKEDVLEATEELQELLLGPMPKIFQEISITPTRLTSLHAMARFKMATAFPPTSTTTVDELSKACGLDQDDCSRLVRHAVAFRLFLEPEPGVIAHSGMSNAIATIPYMREWLEEGCENMWSASTKIVPAMEKWPGTQEPNQTAFGLAKQTDKTFFEYLGADKSGAKAKRFADSMSFYQSGPGMQTALVIDNYDWGNCKKMVDVGGSHGVIALELARRFPDIECTVQDLPEVIGSVTEQAERVTFEAYDFFTEQPVKGADVYFFRMILHNWSDKYCVQILRNLIPALKKGARIVINDHVVPPPGVLSLYKERPVRGFDLVMKQLFNAKERDINDWTELLRMADERFKFVQVIAPKGSQLQMIEVQWE